MAFLTSTRLFIHSMLIIGTQSLVRLLRNHWRSTSFEEVFIVCISAIEISLLALRHTLVSERDYLKAKFIMRLPPLFSIVTRGRVVDAPPRWSLPTWFCHCQQTNETSAQSKERLQIQGEKNLLQPWERINWTRFFLRVIIRDKHYSCYILYKLTCQSPAKRAKLLKVWNDYFLQKREKRLTPAEAIGWNHSKLSSEGRQGRQWHFRAFEFNFSW